MTNRKTISKDTPLSEITFRRYEKPYDLEGRELIRKLCLSIGLLQPGDSRDVIVDVFYVLLEGRKQDKELSSEQIKNLVIETRKNSNLALAGIASSNIRRQIKRLRDLLLVEKIRNNYRITEFTNLNDIFEEKFMQYLLPTVIGRVKEYFKTVDEKYRA